MKKFARHRTVDEIRAMCAAQNVPLDTSRHDDIDIASDHIVVGDKTGGFAIYSVVNGRFFGRTPDGIEYSSNDKRDGEPWFDSLLRFFYVG